MSTQIILALLAALLGIIVMAVYFIFRANKVDYSKIICSKCGAENMVQIDSFVAENGDKVVVSKCGKCGFVSHDVA
ncbi:MAG: hypothetical protein ACK5KT_11505 [Dysgonomonas sp.]